MADPLLSLKGVSKRFGGLTVTDTLSLDLCQGEIHALIGPNGAGKTTLINLISGTLSPDEGRVLFAGTDVTRWSLQRRARAGLARSFQITSVLERFTARDNVALAAQARAGSSFRFVRPVAREAALNRAAEAELAAVGLGSRAGTQAASLSHGEKRQLELAMVLATAPRLLVLDEPLAGAGPEETARLVGLLRTLRGRFGILLVEHDMDAVFALADRISVLVNGRLVVTGDAATVRAHPEVRSAYLGDDALA
ncbi:MAG: ABC transporter ATP-binding protein [Rhodospirillales bacterium 69-11]|nr:MAG: ABC transporter ATP-binding protein [Rhodospirillales bacterium 69-11]